MDREKLLMDGQTEDNDLDGQTADIDGWTDGG